MQAPCWFNLGKSQPYHMLASCIDIRITSGRAICKSQNTSQPCLYIQLCSRPVVKQEKSEHL